MTDAAKEPKESMGVDYIRNFHANLERRLDNFESKLDKVADALVKLAAIEERTYAHNVSLQQIWDKLNVQALKISAIEKDNVGQGLKIGGAERIVWLVVAAIIGIAAKNWK